METTVSGLRFSLFENVNASRVVTLSDETKQRLQAELDHKLAFISLDPNNELDEVVDYRIISQRKTMELRCTRRDAHLDIAVREALRGAKADAYGYQKQSICPKETQETTSPR